MEKWLIPLMVVTGILISAPGRTQEVTGRGTGVVGGVVAGTEIVLAVESIIRVKPLWAWLAIPAAGAVGGGIGGYKLEKISRGGAIALLITGMVGVIPTAIAVSSARSFHPEDVGARQGSDGMRSVDFNYPDASNTNGAPPEGNTAESTVEIEERPDGIPDGVMGPPAPEDPNGELDPNGGGESEDQSSDEPPSDTIDDESNAYELKIEKDSSALSSRKAERLAHLSSGALFHMNRSYRLGLGIPAVDVYPVQLPQPYERIRGTVVHIPLLAVDWP